MASPPTTQAALNPLRFTVTFPGLTPEHGPESKTFDFTEMPLPRLTGELASAFRNLCEIDGSIGTANSAEVAAGPLRAFVQHLAGRGSPPQSVRDLRAKHLDDFEDALRERFPRGRHPYLSLWYVVQFLQEIPRDQFDPGLAKRIEYIANGEVGTTTPRNAYSEHEVTQIVRACQRDIDAVIRRITVEGRTMLEAGREPAEQSDWKDPNNVVWAIDQQGVISHAKLGRLASPRIAQRTSLRELHQRLYPSQADLLPFFILIALRSGIEVEGVRGLLANCQKNESEHHVTIEYRKRRRHGDEWRSPRLRKGGSRTVAGLLKMVLRLTRDVRRHFPRPELWLCYVPNQGRFGVATFDARSKWCPIKDFVQRHGIVGDDGEPLKLELSRLRKVYWERTAHELGGDLDATARAAGHTKLVGLRNYGNIQALSATNEATVAEGLTDALAVATRAAGPLVITPEKEAEFRVDPDRAAQALGATPEAAADILSGERDVFLSSCLDFHDSPFAQKGQPCRHPFWGCLFCRNAVFSERKLPNVIAFLDSMLQERALLSDDEWVEKFGQAYVAITLITESFPPQAVLDARAVAEQSEPLNFLPIELFTPGDLE